MKCVICKHGETRPGMTTVTLERGGATLVVKGVPARICGNCGEAYVDGDYPPASGYRRRSDSRRCTGGCSRIRRSNSIARASRATCRTIFSIARRYPARRTSLS